MDFNDSGEVPEINMEKVRDNNPFKIETPKEFSQMDPFSFDSSEQTPTKRLSLIERNTIVQPKVPNSSRNIPQYKRFHNSKSRELSQNSFNLDGPKTERKQTVREMIQERKDIFRNNLMMRVQNSEIKKMEMEMEESERNLEKEEQKSMKELNDLEKKSHEVDHQLQLTIQSLEQTKSERIQKEKDLKFKKSAVERLKSEFSHSTALIEEYQEYYDFLNSLPRPADCKKPQDYYKTVDQLDDYFDEVSKENVFICNQISDMQNTSRTNQEQYKKEIQEFNEQLKRIRPISPLLKQSDMKKAENAELHNEEEDEQVVSSVKNPYQAEIDYITSLVLHLHEVIYGRKTSLTALEMLTKVEATMEELYQKIDKVNQTFVKKKLDILKAKKDKEDREAERERREQYYYEKKMATLARATRPVKKPTGRKLNPRSYISPRAKGKEEIQQDLEKKQAEEEFLFGPIDY